MMTKNFEIGQRYLLDLTIHFGKVHAKTRRADIPGFHSFADSTAELQTAIQNSVQDFYEHRANVEKARPIKIQFEDEVGTPLISPDDIAHTISSNHETYIRLL